MAYDRLAANRERVRVYVNLSPGVRAGRSSLGGLRGDTRPF